MIKKYFIYGLLAIASIAIMSCGESDAGLPAHKKFLEKYESTIMTQAQIDEYVRPDNTYIKINDEKLKFKLNPSSFKPSSEGLEFSLAIPRKDGSYVLVYIEALSKDNKYNIKYFQKKEDGLFDVTHEAKLASGDVYINLAKYEFTLKMPKTELKSEKSGDKSVFMAFKITQKDMAGGSASVTLKNSSEILITGGDLGGQTYRNLKKLLDENPQVATITLGQVNGSIDDKINVETGRMIRARGLNTRVLKDSKIASGGVDLYASGVVRYYTRGAQIGVHSWAGGGKTGAEYPKDHKAHYSQLGYFTKMLPKTGYDFYFYTLKAAPANDIHYMSEKELEKYKVIV